MSQFMEVVRRIGAGSLLEDIDDHITEVAAAIRNTGKKGAITVKLEMEPNGEAAYSITGTVTAAHPKVQYARSHFYTDPNGHLTRTPPADEMPTLMGIDGDKAVKKGGAA